MCRGKVVLCCGKVNLYRGKVDLCRGKVDLGLEKDYAMTIAFPITSSQCFNRSKAFTSVYQQNCD